MTPAQKSYAKTLAILGLAGGLGGMAVQQTVVDKTTFGSNVLSTVLGAMAVLIPAGVWMRVTGKQIWSTVPGDSDAVFAGLDLNASGNIYGRGGTVDQLSAELAQQKADVGF